MNQRARYFDTNGRQIAEDDALDRNGVLRSGFSLRVPTMMRDADRRGHRLLITDGRTNDPTALNRPGFRVPLVNDRRSVNDAYQQYQSQISNRYKCGDSERLCDDCDGEGFIDGERCVRCNGEGTLPLEDEREEGKSLFGSGNGNGRSSDAQTMKDQAYQSYDHDLANAWRRG